MDDDSIDFEAERIIMQNVDPRKLQPRPPTPDVSDYEDETIVCNECLEDALQRPGGLHSLTERKTGRDRPKTNKSARDQKGLIEKFTLSCLSKDGLYGYFVTETNNLYKIPIQEINSARTFPDFLVYTFPQTIKPVDMLDLGTSLCICSETKLVLLEVPSAQVIFEYDFKNLDSPLASYTMQGYRMFEGNFLGKDCLFWWVHRSHFVCFQKSNNTLLFFFKDSFNLRGKIRPGVGANSRCYCALNTTRGYVFLCFCDDSEIILFKHLEAPSVPVQPLKKIVNQHHASHGVVFGTSADYFQHTEVITIMSLNGFIDPRIFGLSLTPEGFLILIRDKGEICLEFYLFNHCKDKKPTFYSRATIDADPYAERPIRTIPRSAKLVVGSQVYFQDAVQPDDTLAPTRTAYSIDCPPQPLTLSSQSRIPVSFRSPIAGRIFFALGANIISVSYHAGRASVDRVETIEGKAARLDTAGMGAIIVIDSSGEILTV